MALELSILAMCHEEKWVDFMMYQINKIINFELEKNPQFKYEVLICTKFNINEMIYPRIGYSPATYNVSISAKLAQCKCIPPLGNVGSMRNLLLNQASGLYKIFVDQDDIQAPFRYAVQKRVLDRGHECVGSDKTLNYNIRTTEMFRTGGLSEGSLAFKGPGPWQFRSTNTQEGSELDIYRCKNLDYMVLLNHGSNLTKTRSDLRGVRFDFEWFDTYERDFILRF